MQHSHVGVPFFHHRRTARRRSARAQLSNPRARALLMAALPAPLVGIGASLVLLVVVALSELWQRLLWQMLPAALGVSASAWWWPICVLTWSGIAVGLVVKYVPGHAGPDPATVSLLGPPLPLSTLPGLGVALVLALGGGVSLGPENPIIAIVVSLTVWAGMRVWSKLSAQSWMMLGVAGIIGAMFGSPFAAALLLSEVIVRGHDEPLWDRLFAPLVAAAAGSLTTDLFERPRFVLAIEPYVRPRFIDVLSGTLIGIAAIMLAMIVVWLFPHAYRFFRGLRRPVLALGVGGLGLGLLGAVGGPITLFKGLAEMNTLAGSAATVATSSLALIVAVKLAAILVAASCGFRGGRIFPMVFAGVAFGLLVQRILPFVPVQVAVACSVLGFVLVVTRQGWLSLFMAAVLVPGTQLIPVLCIAVLPAWLLLVGKPELELKAQPR